MQSAILTDLMGIEDDDGGVELQVSPLSMGLSLLINANSCPEGTIATEALALSFLSQIHDWAVHLDANSDQLDKDPGAVKLRLADRTKDECVCLLWSCRYLPYILLDWALLDACPFPRNAPRAALGPSVSWQPPTSFVPDPAPAQLFRVLDSMHECVVTDIPATKR